MIPPDFKTIFSAFLKNTKMTNIEVARALGYSNQALYRLKNQSSVSLESLYMLSDISGKNPSTILKWAEVELSRAEDISAINRANLFERRRNKKIQGRYNELAEEFGDIPGYRVSRTRNYYMVVKDSGELVKRFSTSEIQVKDLVRQFLSGLQPKPE